VTIKVLYFAALRDLFGCSDESMALAPGTTLAELAEILAQRAPALKGHLRSLAWGVNFEFAPLQTALKDGDEVALLPPVSGGAR
jgi:molybdopterin converting factor subunit 1